MIREQDGTPDTEDPLQVVRPVPADIRARAAKVVDPRHDPETDETQTRVEQLVVGVAVVKHARVALLRRREDEWLLWPRFVVDVVVVVVPPHGARPKVCKLSYHPNFSK